MAGNDEFTNALRFMTVIPVASSDTATAPDWLSRCVKYFPLVGIGIGVASAAALLIAGKIWGPGIAALLAVATSIVLTGGLHEDGLADTSDSFGGGRTLEKRLAIMKDSRIGAYGALALGFGVALRVVALAGMPLWAGVAALIAAHAAARVTPALVMRRLSYAGDTAAMKVSYADAPVNTSELQFALAVAACALVPLAFVSFTSIISGLLLGAALAAALAAWSRKLIGGYTGDVLGAVEQLFEIGFLLGVAAAIR
jgi:adenosylcobinamide-GDP ribazoletransferase